MRGKIKVVSFVLCAVFMLGLASTVNAQINWNVSSNPNQVTQYGVTELMGRVRLQAAAPGTTVGSTITITYQGVTIKNTAATGITLGGTASGTVAISQVVPSTGTGGQVILAVTGGTGLVADELTIDGVRADVSTLALATDVQASLSSTSSTANTFVNVSVVRVATVNKALDVAMTASSSVFCLNPNNPTITLTEGFSGAFVQYVTSAAGSVPSSANPTAARVKYGANRNIRLSIVVSTLPTDTTLTWPVTVPIDIDGAGPGTATSSLELVAQSASGDNALYEFTTTDQGVSDQFAEVFAVTPTLVFNPDTSEPGSTTAQARLEPQDTPTSTEVPRFNHPYIPPATTFFTVNKCTTNLLFTFVTNATGVGFDSGIAIANTSQDPYGTAPQHGTITAYFYGTNAPAPLTSADVPAGSVWANSLSTIAPGFQGYIIAIAQFQYAHGYAFITGKYNAGSVYDVAEGYVAVVIPDPTFTPLAGVAHRYAGPPPQNNIAIPPSSGEQLGQ
jgi:hypothetical protein